MRTMQINQKGSWRTLVQFSADREEEVAAAAVSLARIVGATLRICDESANPVRWWRPLREWTAW